MQVIGEDALPAWVRDCTDVIVRARLGSPTFLRGLAYADEGAVQKVTLLSDGRGLLAAVRGSGRQTYQTLVLGPRAGVGRLTDWTSSCSCPMQTDCKHVAATLIAARRSLTAVPVPEVSHWERHLSPLLELPTQTAEPARLALQLEVVNAKSTRYAAQADPRRVQLRPMTTGKNGGWIKTGVGWKDLDSSYQRVAVDPEQREALRALLHLFRTRQPAWFSPYSEVSMHLQDLGSNVWRLLAQVEAVGVPLIGPRPGDVIEIAEAVEIAVDLRREQEDGPVVLGAVVAAGGVLLGNPAHGMFRSEPGRLLLTPFTKPLTKATTALVEQGQTIIPATDVTRFLSHYYPALRQQITVTSSDGSVALPQIRPPRLVLDVAFEAGHRARLSWAFGYDVHGELVRIPLLGREALASRDVLAEAALLETLPDVPGRYTDQLGRTRVDPQTLLTGLATARFVEHTLPGLQQREDYVVVVTGEPVAYSYVEDAPQISVAAHDATDGDWFDLTVAVSVAGEEVPIAGLIVALTQGQQHLLLDSGTWFDLDVPELHSLRRLIEEARSLQDKDSAGLRLSPYHAGLWEELVSLGVIEHQSARWERQVSGLLDLDKLPQPDPPDQLLATLRPYQLEGYHWLSVLWDHQLGGVLADDMGLGKTLQTLAMAARAKDLATLGGTSGPLLIVAPTSVVGTWASEAARFTPGLTVVAVTETEKRAGVPLTQQAQGADLVVTSYALLRIDEEAYRGQTWCGLVLDEAQFVKNHQAKTYQCARRLPAPFKLAITGTPLENSLMDLWSMLSITAPGLFPNPQRFSELYRKPIENGTGPEQLATLRRRIRPLMLRRTKEQVATDLPPKIEQHLPVVLNPAHRKVYDQHFARERQRVLGLLDDLQKNRIAIFRSLTLLRQLSLDVSLVDDTLAGTVRSSKIDVLLEQLAEVVAEGHRVLVFSQFTGFLALVKSRLEAEGLPYCYLDGRTRDRPKRIAEFRDGDAPVFLISLKAGGVGLTLTEADYVFVLDPWWNPAAEAQAVDRTHRIGQDKTVMVYRLVATDTIEEKVVALQQRKKELFDRVVGEDAMASAALSAEDLRGLFA